MNDGPTGPTPIHLERDHVLHSIQRGAILAGVLGIALGTLGAVFSPTQFFRSYLVAYTFWFGIALGCLGILMIHHVAGGAWSAVIRRPLESATRTLPLLAVLFLPIAFGVHHLYEWAQAEHVAHDAILQHKSLYLNVPFFLGRAAAYFAVWIGIGLLLNRWSLEQDRTSDPSVARRLELLSRGGLVLVGLTMTFASVDWLMSLEPHWYSTIFGILVIGGQVLTAMAFIIPVAALLARRGPLSSVISTEQFHDLGKLLLAFVMLWTYFSLSQYLIIWSANLPEETPWYLTRQRGSWQWISIALILFNFALPLVVLLSRDVKRRAAALTTVALGIIAIRFVDSFWLIAPAFHPGGVSIHWLDIVTAVGVGGIWLSTYIWQLQRYPLLPLHDPALPTRT